MFGLLCVGVKTWGLRILLPPATSARAGKSRFRRGSGLCPVSLWREKCRFSRAIARKNGVFPFA